MSNRQGTHSQLYYHFVWTTKNRELIIDDQLELEIKKVVLAKGKELKIDIIEVSGTQDHLHVLVRANPSLAPAEIAKHLKGSSSYFVNRVTLKDHKIRNLYWQDGYAVLSVSPAGVKAVSDYVKNQKEHHAKKELRHDFEATLGID